MAQEKKSRNRLWIILALFGVVLLIPTTFWLILFSRFFSIEYISVEAKGISESDVRSNVFAYMDTKRGLFNPGNILMFNPHDSEKLLRDTFQVEQLAIKKKFPSTIRISITAKPFRFLAYADGSFYDITTRGTLGRQIDPESIEFYPTFILSYKQLGRSALSKPLKQDVPTIPLIFLNGNSIPPDASAQILTDNQLAHISEVKKLMDATKMKALFFRIDGKEPDYAVMTKYGWEARFSTLAAPQEQLDRLQTLFNEKLKEKKRDIDYVDLRFGSKVYYRLL